MSSKPINFIIDTTLNNTVTINKLIKRGDTLDLEIKVFENGVVKDLAGESISLILEKADKTNVEKSIVNINNPLKIKLDVQATNSIGFTSGEVCITDNNGNISSNTFTYEVVNDLSSRILESSKDDCETLDQLKKVVNQNTEVIENYKEAIQDVAGTTESAVALSEIKKYIGPNLENLTLQNNKSVTNKNNLDAANVQAVKNYDALNQLGDATNLAKKVEANTTQLSEMAKQDFRVISTSGLNVTVEGGKIVDGYENVITFVESIVALEDNRINYICFDLYNKTLHAFRRNIHDGCLWVATVETLNGSIISINQPKEIKLSKNRLERVKRKIGEVKSKTSICIIGDSLSEAAGTGTKWTDLLTTISTGYTLTNASVLTIDNYALGSQTSHYGLALLGESIKGITGLFENACVKYKKESAMKQDLNLKQSPVLANKYDLAIIGFGMNGGTDKYNYLESIIRLLRKNGTDVLLITQNNVKSNVETMYYDGGKMKKLAESYGCSIADTWCFVREQEALGLDVSSDGTHMNQIGHNAYALAIRSVLNDLVQNGETVMNENDMITNNKYTNYCETMFTPIATTGTTVASQVSDKNKSFPLLFGSKTQGSALTKLEVGQYAIFAHPHAYGFDILNEWTTSFTADVKSSSAEDLLGTISNVIYGSTKIGLTEGLDYTNEAVGAPSYVNRYIKILCTSGTLNLAGVVFRTLKNAEHSLDNVIYNGNWNNEAWLYGLANCKYTDTIGDTFEFEFEGNGFQIALARSNRGGTVEISVNGAIITSRDLYTVGTATVYNYDYFACSGQDNFVKGKQKMKVKVKLKSVNASAIDVASQYRRLTILNIYTFNS